jgi:hypothetical protein
MKIHLLIFLALFTFLSCKRQPTSSGPTSIRGQVVDAGSGKGIYDATVGLVQQPKGSFGAAGMKQVAGVSSDRNGNFSFNFNYDENYDYDVLATANYYYDSNGGVNINAGTNKNVKVRLTPKGFVKFFLHNVPPLDTASIFITLEGAPEVHSIYKDTFVFGWSAGNSKESFIHTIGKPSGYINFHDTIFIPPLDTVTYTINY